MPDRLEMNIFGWVYPILILAFGILSIIGYSIGNNFLIVIFGITALFCVAVFVIHITVIFVSGKWPPTPDIGW